jgi:hypothetical protein
LVLAKLGATKERVIQEVELHLVKDGGGIRGEFQLTPHAKRTIDLAHEEAQALQSEKMGSEHLLLGLLREEEGVAARVLLRLGVTYEEARQAVIQHCSAIPGPPPFLNSPARLAEFLRGLPDDVRAQLLSTEGVPAGQLPEAVGEYFQARVLNDGSRQVILNAAGRVHASITAKEGVEHVVLLVPYTVVVSETYTQPEPTPEPESA